MPLHPKYEFMVEVLRAKPDFANNLEFALLHSVNLHLNTKDAIINSH